MKKKCKFNKYCKMYYLKKHHGPRPSPVSIDLIFIVVAVSKYINTFAYKNNVKK